MFTVPCEWKCGANSSKCRSLVPELPVSKEKGRSSLAVTATVLSCKCPFRDTSTFYEGPAYLFDADASRYMSGCVDDFVSISRGKALSLSLAASDYPSRALGP